MGQVEDLLAGGDRLEFWHVAKAGVVLGADPENLELLLVEEEVPHRVDVRPQVLVVLVGVRIPLHDQ